MTTDKPIRYTTPPGVAVFPRLNEPDAKFKDAGEYSVILQLSEADAAPLLAQLQPIYDAAIDAASANPKNKNKKLVDWPLYSDAIDANKDVIPGVLQFKFKKLASGVSKKTGKAWNI